MGVPAPGPQEQVGVQVGGESSKGTGVPGLQISFAKLECFQNFQISQCLTKSQKLRLLYKIVLFFYVGYGLNIFLHSVCQAQCVCRMQGVGWPSVTNLCSERTGLVPIMLFSFSSACSNTNERQGCSLHSTHQK